jgi:aminopeptidase N
MFDSHSYAKGGRILHMLRKYVGDDAFFKSLELYLKTHEFSSVEVHNLRLAFEKITGEDLNWFFNQWFLASGHPQLKIENTHSGDSVVLRVLQEQDLETTPLYRLPLYVDVWVNNNKERYGIEVKLADETFRFYASQKPDLVVFDADKQLLAEIEFDLSNEELAYQYNNSDKFLGRFQSVSLLANNIDDQASKNVLIKALDDPFWGIRQAAINAFDEYKGDDQDRIKERMVSIIKNDPKSLVRADAISTLSSLDSLGFIDVYKAGMEDPSYAVVGASLFAYGRTNATDKLETLGKFEHLDNANVIIPIAGYYLEERIYEKYDWFHQKIRKVDGPDLYYLLQYFGQFLMGAPQENKREGADLLKDFALTHNAYYVRLAAFYSLSLIREDVEGLTEEMREIIDLEKDPRLLQIYDSF